MSALCLWWAALCGATPVKPAPPAAPTLLPAARLTRAKALRCEACHTPSGWSGATFDHDQTGFPLRGQHGQVRCRTCHPARFDDPLPSGCAGCHRDPHAGDLGARCAACHDEGSWKSRFDADAHRRTNFPLVGRHAALPCEECHGELRERRFSRPAVDCAQCHLADLARTSQTAVDHLRLELGRECRQCHNGWRFSPARFPAHDACFELSAGKHAGLACERCHTSIPAVGPVGACNQRSTACTGCHTHACPTSDPLHVGVLGYECRDRRCYDCHRLTVTP